MNVDQRAVEPGAGDAKFRLKFYKRNEEIYAAELEQLSGKREVISLLFFLHLTFDIAT